MPHPGDSFADDPVIVARVTDLFGRLLDGEELAHVLAGEQDGRVRAEVEKLWHHHGLASKESFLAQPITLEPLPVLSPGQQVAGRFVIERLIGRGGMGEVYLAQDCTLGRLVALKTIARSLAASPGVRQRFLQEVRHAQRVSHDHVCRIHDLIEDGGLVLFSMEYVEGQPLSALLAGDRPVRREARVLLRQLAAGLQAAHRKNVIHGDLKPANLLVVPGPPVRLVIMDFGLARAMGENEASALLAHSLRAGTIGYMAPELLHGAEPSVQSDLFAFGSIATALLPDWRPAASCVRERPEDRPASIDGLLAALEPLPARRYLLGGVIAAAAAGGAVWAGWPKTSLPRLLGDGSRVLVNGFRAHLADLAAARLARAVFITALRQSPRLRVVADQDLLPALRRQGRPAELPAEGELLRQLLAQHRTGVWVDAQVAQTGGRHSLNLRVMQGLDPLPLLQAVFADLPSAVATAQQAAVWLRQQAGESAESLTRNSADVMSFTSAVPEALQHYYEAMAHYAVGEMEQAIPLLEEAIRLDASFAQAYNVLGMCLNSLRRPAEAFQRLERAHQSAGRLPERERAWLDTNYYTLTEDPERMVAAARRSVAFFPDEARQHRVLAQVLCRTGRPAESLPYSRRAVELSPDSDLLWLDLVVNLCEAGDFAQGLQQYQAARAAGRTSAHLERGAGLAYLGLADYAAAQRALEAVPGKVSRFVNGARVLSGNLDSARAALTADLSMHQQQGNIAEEHQVREFLCGLHFLSGQATPARQHVAAMANLPLYPPFARQFQCTAFWAARLGARAVLQSVAEQLAQIERGWSSAHTKALALYARALESAQFGRAAETQQLLLESLGLSETVWTLFDLADLFTRTGQLALAEEYWERFEQRRGTVLKLWFPGVLVMAWANRAVAANTRGDRATAHRFAGKVLDHWAARNPQLPIIRLARDIHASTA